MSAANAGEYVLRFVFEPRLIAEHRGHQIDVPAIVNTVLHSTKPYAQIFLTGAVTSEAMKRAMDNEVEGMCDSIAHSGEFLLGMEATGLAFRVWVEGQP